MYELMVIGNPKLETEQVLALVDKTLKDADAKDIKIDKIGRKNLMFPISKQTEGEYMVFNFEAEGDKVAQINSKLHLEQETILRYLIVRQRVSKVKVSGPKVLAGGQAPEVSKVKKVKVEGKAK